MKILFKVSCSGNGWSIKTFSDIYVIAETFQEASDKALAKMRELKYDLVDDYVSNVEVIADEEESNKKLLII